MIYHADMDDPVSSGSLAPICDDDRGQDYKGGGGRRPCHGVCVRSGMEGRFRSCW